MINLVNQQTRTLWAGCYAGRLYDRRRAEVLLNVPPDVAALHPENPPGLWLVSTRGVKPQLLTDHTFTKMIRADQIGGWYGYNRQEGLVSILRNGQVGPAYSDSAPLIDPAGPLKLRPLQYSSSLGIWLLAGNGFYAAQPGLEPVLIYPVEPEGLWSSPSRADLFFFSVTEGDRARLFAVYAGEWEPILVDEEIQKVESIAWTSY